MKRKILDKLSIYVKVGLVAKISHFKVWLGCLLASTLGYAEEDRINGHIEAVSNQLANNVGNVPGNRYNGNMVFDYWANQNKKDPNKVESRFTLAALVNDKSLLMYSVQEAYVGMKFGNRHEVRFGRQILDWSAVDQTWGFGKINNRRNFNYFEPGQEGLIGLDWKYQADNGFRLKLFATPFYIPELNPALDINKKNGTIKSRNPWTDTPASSAEVSPGNYAPIFYDVHYPSISSIIFKPAGGLNLGYQNKNWDWDNFFIRKPENQLTTDVNVRYDSITNVVKADIKPNVYYHDVYGTTLKYQNQGLAMYMSAIAIRPNDFPYGSLQATQYTQIKTEKRREDYVGGGISYREDIYSYGLNYVARLSPFDRDKEELATDPRWNQAINIFATMQMTSKFSLAGDGKFDMLTTDRLVMLRAIYQFSRQFVGTLGMNMIGTPKDGKSYWSTYTDNDAVYAGLRYVF